MDKSPFARRAKYPHCLAGIRVSDQTWQALISAVETSGQGLSDLVREALDSHLGLTGSAQTATRKRTARA